MSVVGSLSSPPPYINVTTGTTILLVTVVTKRVIVNYYYYYYCYYLFRLGASWHMLRRRIMTYKTLLKIALGILQTLATGLRHISA